MRLVFALVSLSLLAVAPGCSVTGESGECGPAPDDGCSEAECVTDPRDPDYASCGGYLYACRDGGWVRNGYCEFWDVEAEGTWRLAQQGVVAGDCPALVTRTELVLQADSDDVVTTAEPAIAVLETIIDADIYRAGISMTLEDQWAVTGSEPVTVTVTYDLEIAPTNEISGTATADLPWEGGSCRFNLTVTGTREYP